MKQFRWLSEETPHVYTDLGDVEKDKVGAALHKAVAGCSASLAKKMPQGREKDIGCVTCGRTESEQPNEIILCDGTGCSVGCHVWCAGLTAVPEGDWFCSVCSRARRH